MKTFTDGELIWTRNDITSEYGYRPVIATKATPDQPIFQVTVKNNQGEIETLETTAEHSFWIKETGWLKASLLIKTPQMDMSLIMICWVVLRVEKGSIIILI
ncbi:polymorphic toxin-type HINT domain-containing protein [Moraxella cuniculi]|uniref:polymorphic toxin-type HINT domain-containing protein n=1 Tax=Moraxella cuniculi TaxID=34061 RepID=UPI000F81F833